MSLQLYDTATRAVRDFVPREPGRVGMYVCGLTVQSEPHVGHLRSYVSFDVLRRWLQHRGFQVTHVRNVTDIDDKVLAKSVERGVPWWAIAYANERLLEQASTTLGCLDPTYEPRATGHVPQMVALIERLLERGHAYRAGPGEVYFDVRSYDGYGGLSNRRLEDMQPAEDGAGGKRDPRDFALWKGVKPDEPRDAYWDTPWGRGRPGWHLECSAMAQRYLGDEFDIHGGGLDLVFPHHENEIAQSRAAGYGFARYWMHNGMLNLAGGKMSKSEGNVIDLPSVLATVRPAELRYFLLAPHYRSSVEYSAALLSDAAAAYRRIEGFVQRAVERFGAEDTAPGRGTACADFVTAMDDDLNTPKAVAAIHEVVREGNSALAGGSGADRGARGAAASVRSMLAVLGLDPVSADDGKGAPELRTVVDVLVRVVLEQRDAARARKDWATADALRDQLKRSGVLIEDTPHGPRWTLADGGA